MIDTYRTFINYNYVVSTGNYVKVIIEMGEGAYMKGFFSVILNPRTMKTQIGKMKYEIGTDNKIRYRNIFGQKNHNDYLILENVIINYLNGDGHREVSLLKTYAKELKFCFKELKRSFQSYLKVDDSIQFEDVLQVNEYINKLIENFNKIINDNNYNSDEIEIVNNNNDDESNSSFVRKTITIAKMKNADGLTEFINGNFYPVVNKEYYRSQEFYTLIADNGDERKINANRLELIEVYAEPPIY
jgi:hypothetical protein